MRGLAMPVPGFRIGNSSSGEVKAFAEPGFRIGNSSSSIALGIGMGAEMVPRMDFGAGLRPGLARPEPDFQSVGIVALRDGQRREAALQTRRCRDEIKSGPGQLISLAKPTRHRAVGRTMQRGSQDRANAESCSA